MAILGPCGREGNWTGTGLPRYRIGMRRRLLASILLGPMLAACAAVRFDVPGAADEAGYRAAHPTYAEYCALSQIKKKQGFGADIRGEIGGHAVFYLNGACLVRDAHYPVLEACDAHDGGGDGVGLSMNAHFRNAKWVATPGRDFFFAGGLGPDVPVTRETYRGVAKEAQRLGVYDGVAFWPWVFEDKQAGWSDADWKYEVSIATDWAIALGRGRYCARVPVTRAQMGRMIDFLNAENAPYREGRREFDWSIFNDNCIHLAHNALAAAGLWERWPTERFLPIAVLDFPVPRNEFVNLMRRTNDAWMADPGAVYRDLAARSELLSDGRLPTGPGALAEARGPQLANEVYETRLKMIFYDEPILGSYQESFDRVFAEPRYLDAGANRLHFGALARAAVADRRPLLWWLSQAPYRGDPAGFALIYERFYALMDRLAAS